MQYVAVCAHPPVSMWINQENLQQGRGDSMQEISYIGDERTKKAKRLMRTGQEGPATEGRKASLRI